MKQYSNTECPKERCAEKLRIARILKKSFQKDFDLKRKELEGCLSEVKELTICYKARKGSKGNDKIDKKTTYSIKKSR